MAEHHRRQAIAPLFSKVCGAVDDRPGPRLRQVARAARLPACDRAPIPRPPAAAAAIEVDLPGPMRAHGVCVVDSVVGDALLADLAARSSDRACCSPGRSSRSASAPHAARVPVIAGAKLAPGVRQQLVASDRRHARHSRRKQGAGHSLDGLRELRAIAIFTGAGPSVKGKSGLLASAGGDHRPRRVAWSRKKRARAGVPRPRAH